MTLFSLYERSQGFVSNHLEVASAHSGTVRGSLVMERARLSPAALQDFLLDAQDLLSEAQDCLQHLELIGSDADACLYLTETLDTLARRADAVGVFEITHHASSLQQLLKPACAHGNLQSDSLSALGDCLTLLDWQLELVDADTGRVYLDIGEQHLVLGALADALHQPMPQPCAHCTQTAHPALQDLDA